MSICGDCDLLFKLQKCCEIHPETGAYVDHTLDDGREVRACPNLDIESGGCTVYGGRPDVCKEYACSRLKMTCPGSVTYHQEHHLLEF